MDQNSCVKRWILSKVFPSFSSSLSQQNGMKWSRDLLLSSCQIWLHYNFPYQIIQTFSTDKRTVFEPNVALFTFSPYEIAWGTEFMTRYTGKRPTNANSVQLTPKMLEFTFHGENIEALTNIKINGHGLCYNYMCTQWSHLPFLAPGRKRDLPRWFEWNPRL